MDIGVEISLYPLQQDYRAPIRALLERLAAQQQVRVVTSSLSTQIFGEYEIVMRLLSHELRAALAGPHQAVILMKLVGPLPG